MRIGIDVDGVLTDICQWQLDCGSKYSFEHNLKGIVNPYSQETYDVFELNKFEDDDFWNKYLYEYIMYEPARRYASEVIKDQEGYDKLIDIEDPKIRQNIFEIVNIIFS